MSLPSKVVAVYWTRWNSGTRLTACPQGYNLFYLFAATKGGSEGVVNWGQNDVVADIKTCRARGQRIVLSCGGAGQGIDFSSRTVSTAFVDSIVRINGELGGTLSSPILDGVDFNTFEAGATRNTAEYTWMGQELKRRFGAGFSISAPPAPWNQTDKDFCKALLAAGAMDYAAPQYYDGPGLSDPSFISGTGSGSVTDWVNNVAGGDASKIVVGFGISAGTANYSTTAQCVQAWNTLKGRHPNLRGVFLWQHQTDANQGWSFANQVSPLVGPTTNPTPPPVVPPPDTSQKITIGSASYPLAGVDVDRGSDALVVYTAKQATSPANVWGAEAIVVGGKVTALVDRQTTQAAGVSIPTTGYVLSGHGAARDFLMANAKVGATVSGYTPPAPPAGGLTVPTSASLADVIKAHNALVGKLGLA